MWETGLICGIEERAIVVVPYRPDRKETFRQHRERIAAADRRGGAKGRAEGGEPVGG